MDSGEGGWWRGWEEERAITHTHTHNTHKNTRSELHDQHMNCRGCGNLCIRCFPDQLRATAYVSLNMCSRDITCIFGILWMHTGHMELSRRLDFMMICFTFHLETCGGGHPTMGWGRGSLKHMFPTLYRNHVQRAISMFRCDRSFNTVNFIQK